MKKVESNKQSGLRDMFSHAANGEEYSLNSFKNIYCRYFGCGNHLYILANECDENNVSEIGNQRIHPREMAKQLSIFINDFRVIMIDVEMGGMSVCENQVPPSIGDIKALSGRIR